MKDEPASGILYTSLGGRRWCESEFSTEEASFLRQKLAWAFGEPRPRSDTFHNSWLDEAKCGLPRESWESADAPLVRVCRNVFLRLATDEGRFAAPGLSSALHHQIEDRFGGSKAFAKATGRHPGRLSRIVYGQTTATIEELDGIARDLGFRITLEPSVPADA